LVSLGSRDDDTTEPDLSLSRRALLPSPPGYAAAAVARNVGFYLLALGRVPMLALWNGWIPLLAAPLIGLAYYRLTLVMHDCIHATLLGRPSANLILGTTLGALCGIEFRAFSRLHWQHHRLLGRADDPQSADYLVGRSATRTALIIHLLGPLAGVALVKLGQVFAALERFDPQHPLRRRFALAFVIGTQLIIAMAVSKGLRSWWLALLPLGSAATFGLFFAQLRGFAEHVAMPGVAPEGFVRSHRASVIGRMLLYDLNFNLHREHHLHPAIPSYYLPELHRRLREAGEVEAPASGMFATVRDRLTAAAAGITPKVISA
jgi:fatty acid desaturase